MSTPPTPSGRRSEGAARHARAARADGGPPGTAKGARNGAPNGRPPQQGRGIRDQIRRYRASFIAVIGMVVIAAVVGGYVLSNERLSLPSGFPFLGRSHFILKAYFNSAQALAPGQGEAVTIAGAKVGEIDNVELHDGNALVTMELTPKFARIYRDATLLARPKTPLEDMTVEIDPGTPSTGRLKSGAVLPVSQTAPNVHFDQFIASLDTETRAYLQQLLAAAAEGLKGQGNRLAAAYKRFDPLSRNVAEITTELSHYHSNIARSIHNFTLLVQALGEVEKQISELVVNSNHVFRVFASRQGAVERTIQLLPGALSKTQTGLGKLATAAHYLGPTLASLHTFAKDLGPAERAAQPSFRQITPILQNQIRPFAREAEPVLAKVTPALSNFSKALPGLTLSFSVLNELFNELAYNPGSGKGGFLFFADWAAHDINSVYSTADANGALGQALPFFNCHLLEPIKDVAHVDPVVAVLIDLLNLPEVTCPGPKSAAVAAAVKPVLASRSAAPSGSRPKTTDDAARAVGRSAPRTASPATTTSTLTSGTASSTSTSGSTTEGH